MCRRVTIAAMGIVELIGVAASISLLAGWRLYLCVFAVGVAMHTGWVALPDQLHMLDALANPWVIGIAGVGAVAEFFADKVMWLDSIWDTVHTLIRPIGGAILALALVDPSNPSWQVAVFLLGGGASLMTHGAKATTRAVVNVSPEPVSNIAVSSVEDVTTGGLLVLALANPVAAVIIAVVLAVAAIVVLIYVGRLLRRLLRTSRPELPGR